MTKEQMERETLYLGTMLVAKNLLKQGIISEQDYVKIDTKYKEIYQITLSTLYTDIDLIKCEIYGNM